MVPEARPKWPLLLLAAAALAADQISKYAVERLTQMGTTHVVIPGFLNIVHTMNPGVAFGLLADSETPWRAPLLILFAVAVIALIAWLLYTGRAGRRLGEIGMTLILGGALGNLLDRILRHSVTDFIDCYVGRYHWYTFNVADSAIVLGAMLVILELFRDWRHPSQERA
jgi:signal peptidase II